MAAKHESLAEIALLPTGKYTEAVSEFRRTLERDPANAHAQERMAQLQFP